MFPLRTARETHRLALGTANKDEAAKGARRLFKRLHGAGWEQPLAEVRPKPEPKLATIDDHIEEAMQDVEVEARTLNE